MRWAAGAGRSVPAGELRPASGQATRPAAAARPVHGAEAVSEGPACPAGFQAAARLDDRVSPVGPPEVRLASCIMILRSLPTTRRRVFPSLWLHEGRCSTVS